MAGRSSGHDAQRELLLRIFDEGYRKPTWHGPNLRSTVRGVTAEQAVWRPGPGRRCIGEIALHCAYWKYAVRRRILGGKRGSFPLKGSNWFDVPARLTQAEWRGYTALLDQEHDTLYEAIATAPWPRLCVTKAGHTLPAPHLHGIALHDTYHTGQIRILKVLYKQAKRRR